MVRTTAAAVILFIYSFHQPTKKKHETCPGALDELTDQSERYECYNLHNQCYSEINALEPKALRMPFYLSQVPIVMGSSMIQELFYS